MEQFIENATPVFNTYDFHSGDAWPGGRIPESSKSAEFCGANPLVGKIFRCKILFCQPAPGSLIWQNGQTDSGGGAHDGYG